MKRKFLWLFFCPCIAAEAQKIEFYFVAPIDIISTNFNVAIDSTSTRRMPAGYAKVKIDENSKNKFNTIAPPYLRYVHTVMQTGQPLRNSIDTVLKNSNGRVSDLFYFLIDDRTGLSNSAVDTSHIFYVYDENTKKYVWPAAFNHLWNKKKSLYVARVMLGEHQLQTDQSQRIGKMWAVDELVLHETSHTQLPGPWTKWGGIGGKAITYGADGMHYLTELIGDQEGAMNEGLATFYGYQMNDSGYLQLVTDLSDNSYRFFVEARSVHAGASELFKITDRKQDSLKNNLGNVFYPDGKPVIIFKYRWKNVPGWYLLFAENTSLAFFSLFRNHTYQNTVTAYSMIRQTTTAMSEDRKKRYLTFACNQLSLKMEEYNNSSKGKADKSKLSSMFPFALLDLLTHFGMPDSVYKKDYVINYPTKHPKAYTEYWKHRSKLQTLVQTDIGASPIKFNDALEKIKEYFKKPEMILAP